MTLNARLFMRQTWALAKKTLITAVIRNWISTILRALILPIAFLVLLLNIKNLILGYGQFGVGSPVPVESLANAIPSSKKLVFVQPSGLGSDVARVVDQISSTLSGKQIVLLTDPNDLLTTCRQSLHGDSDCFGAVVFNDSPLSTGASSKGIWSYTMHTDNAKNGFTFNVNKHKNDQDTVFLPLQVAIENAMTNSTIIPNTYMFTTISQEQQDINIREQYQRLVISTYSIAFFISVVSPIYHVVSMITSERESGMTQLIDAMGGSSHARIMSYILAFDILYLPCWIIFGILFWDELFRTSSIAISIFWQILVGWAITSAAVFSAMFFDKARISGIWSVVGFLIVALCGQLMDWGSPKTATVAAMSFLFPSMNYIFFTGYMCRYEEQGLPTDMLRAAQTTPAEASTSRVPGVILWLFLVLQIFIYPLLAILAERWTHGSPSKSRTVGITNDTQINSPAIKITGLTKIYSPTLWRKWFTWGKKTNVVAVKNLDLIAHNGQILCLLGANGSGKTTTLDMIGGLQRLTSGTIHINAAPSEIGICPQRNVLWDELTVWEHVQIWNMIKFSTADNVAIENLIEACDLTAKTNARAKTLSGGQKRKLQLACTFIGGSSVCLLDEVTSGLDPLSRRIIWDILLAERAKRTLVLTTHFLDEADVLADQVMIISKGELKCEGSTVELKSRLGGGYKVHLEGLSDGPKMDFPSQVIRTETVYNTPDSASAARLLTDLENKDCGKVFVNGPTIEEVFLKVAEEPHIAVDGEPLGKVGTISDELEQARSKTTPEWDSMLSSGSEIGFLQQVGALFHKRCIILIRNWWPYLIALAMPLAVTPNLKSFLFFYKIPSCLDLTADVHPLEQFNFAFGRRDIYPWNHLLVGPPSINASLYSVLSNFGVGVGLNIQNYTNEFTFENTLADLHSYINQNLSKVSPGALFMENNTTAPTYAYVGDFGVEAALLMQNIWTQVRSGVQIEGSFSFFNSLISPTAGNSLEFLAYFCLAQAVYPTLFALYPTYEKTRNVRAIQYSNGIRALPLWTAYALFDFIFVLIISVVCTAIIAAQAPHWFAVSYMFPVLALYGLSSMLMAYCFSLIARSQLAAFAWAAGVQCIMFILSIMAFVLIEAFTDTARLLLALDGTTFGLNLIFPIGNLVRATLVGLNVYIVDCRNGDFIHYPGSIYAYGGPIFYLCLQICFLFWLLSWLEARHKNQHFFRFPFRVPFRHEIATSDEEGEIKKVTEKEVLDEVRRVEDSEDDLLRVLGVAKAFRKTIAVENVSFGIRGGEILALLGPNGAGKSTIINMIRGELSLDNGKILLQDIDMEKQTRVGQRYIGYCPQFDALDIMTVREHLTFYARAKGIKTVSADVNLVMEKIGLQAYENRLASKLSGGNKRKLSLAIALLGNPPLLLLDEPTSSIDASSKRSLWKILLQLNNQAPTPSANSSPPRRSLLLTTHSMEEASHLASRAAILSKFILALGSIKDLRMRWGDVYHVHIVLNSAPDSGKEEMDKVEMWVKERFDGAKVDSWGSIGGQIRFSVPAGLTSGRNEEGRGEGFDKISPVGDERKGSVGKLFRTLESSKDSLGLAFYSVRATSMDEVFLNVVRENNVREAEERGK